MKNYTKTKINFTSFLITLITVLSIYLLLPIIGSWQVQAANQKQESQNQAAIEEITKIADSTETSKKDATWMIEIPSIDLEAEIAEGTDSNTMNKYVGHFTETSKDKGNVGLAAHNRGYPVNYFARVKELKEGDKIYYKYNETKITYQVDKIKIIKDTNWSYLEPTEKNKITLITCVENEPEYRRCIQGTEIT